MAGAALPEWLQRIQTDANDSSGSISSTATSPQQPATAPAPLSPTSPSGSMSSTAPPAAAAAARAESQRANDNTPAMPYFGSGPPDKAFFWQGPSGAPPVSAPKPHAAATRRSASGAGAPTTHGGALSNGVPGYELMDGDDKVLAKWRSPNESPDTMDKIADDLVRVIAEYARSSSGAPPAPSTSSPSDRVLHPALASVLFGSSAPRSSSSNNNNADTKPNGMANGGSSDGAATEKARASVCDVLKRIVVLCDHRASSSAHACALDVMNEHKKRDSPIKDNAGPSMRHSDVVEVVTRQVDLAFQHRGISPANGKSSSLMTRDMVDRAVSESAHTQREIFEARLDEVKSQVTQLTAQLDRERQARRDLEMEMREMRNNSRSSLGAATPFGSGAGFGMGGHFGQGAPGMMHQLSGSSALDKDAIASEMRRYVDTELAIKWKDYEIAAMKERSAWEKDVVPGLKRGLADDVLDEARQRVIDMCDNQFHIIVQNVVSSMARNGVPTRRNTMLGGATPAPGAENGGDEQSVSIEELKRYLRSERIKIFEAVKQQVEHTVRKALEHYKLITTTADMGAGAVSAAAGSAAVLNAPPALPASTPHPDYSGAATPYPNQSAVTPHPVRSIAPTSMPHGAVGAASVRGDSPLPQSCEVKSEFASSVSGERRRRPSMRAYHDDGGCDPSTHAPPPSPRNHSSGPPRRHSSGMVPANDDQAPSGNNWARGNLCDVPPFVTGTNKPLDPSSRGYGGDGGSNRRPRDDFSGADSWGATDGRGGGTRISYSDPSRDNSGSGAGRGGYGNSGGDRGGANGGEYRCRFTPRSGSGYETAPRARERPDSNEQPSPKRQRVASPARPPAAPADDDW